MEIKYKAWDDEHSDWTDELTAEVQAEADHADEDARTTADELATCLTGLGCHDSAPWRVIQATGTREGGVAWIEFARFSGILVWGSALD